MLLKSQINNIKFIFFLFIVLYSFNVRSQDFIWAANTHQQTYGYSGIRSIVTDSKGNIYATGGFGGTVDFDPGSSNFSLTAIPKSQDYTNTFILKLDKNKNFLWVKQISSNWVDRGTSIILDKDENVIITGLATGPHIDLYPDLPGEHVINNTTNALGSYIMKLDPYGNFIFGNFYLGAFTDESTLDNENNIITTGSAGTNVDFDAGNGLYNLNSAGRIFLLKNDSNGNFIWAKRIGSNTEDYPISLACDSQNNIIFKGNFKNNIKFSNINYNTIDYGYNCNFICKVGSNGQELWFRQLGTIGGLISNEDKSVKVDNLNNIYFSSTSSSSFTTNFGNKSLSFNSNASDSFLFKLNQNGEYLWHNSIYGDEGQVVESIGLDSKNSLYLVTSMNGKSFINEDCNKIYPINKSYGSDGGMLLKFNTDGKFINFKNIANTGFSLQCDFENNIIIGGNFRDKPDFDPNPINTYFIHTFYSDGFILKLAPCTTNIPEGDKDQYFCLSTNPTINELKPCAMILNWYDSKTSTIPLERNLPLENGKIYYAAYFESCTENDRLAVTVHLNSPSSIPVVTNSTFCEKDNPKLSNISIIGSNLKWYDSSVGGNELPLSTLLQSNTVYFVSQNENLNGCESYRLPVTPKIQGIELTISSPQTFCSNQNATLDDIVVSGQNKKWYNAATAGVILPNITTVQNDVTYYVSQTIDGCESTRIPVTTKIQNTLAPTGDANQPFCTGQNPTIANIQVTGNSIKWYDSVNNGVLLQQTTNLVDGKTYYASQTTSGCESPRFGITVSIVNTPSAPTGNANQQFCKSENATLNDIQITGQNTKWYDNSFSAVALPHTTVLENNKTYYVSQTIGCESDRTPILVQVHDTPLPIGNTNQQFCIDEIATLENINITGTAIKWYDAATNGNILSETTLLQNSIYYATQTVNNCESKRLAITVKIQDTQNPIADSPQTFCVQQNASIKSINIAGQNIKWYQSTSSNNTLSETTVLENGITYYASQTINNCESDRITINILEATQGDCINFVDELPFPKFFTPNNDGYNDTWTIDFAYLKPNTGIKIFDRYGKFIKEITTNNSWDGTYLGRNEPASDYWFTATRINGKEFRGHFSLKR